PAQERRESMVRWLAIAVAVVSSAAYVASVDVFPTNDGPQHLMAAFVEGHLDALSPPLQARIELPPPLSAHALRWPFLLLDPLVGPWRAYRMVLAFWVLVWSGGAAALVNAVAGRPSWLAVPAAATALCWHFFMGFVNFYAAIAVGAWALA